MFLLRFYCVSIVLMISGFEFRQVFGEENCYPQLKLKEHKATISISFYSVPNNFPLNVWVQQVQKGLMFFAFKSEFDNCKILLSSIYKPEK